jgi:hypothetical protein
MPTCLKDREESWRQLLHRSGYSPFSVLSGASTSSPMGAGSKEPPVRVWGPRPNRQDEAIVDLLARHPLLSRDQLADLLGTSCARIRTLQVCLEGRGWLRQVENPQPSFRDAHHLCELTLAGTREALRRLGLSSTHAAKHHGVLGTESRMRRRMLRHVEHTLGVNQFFVDLVVAARRVTEAGGDDALVNWRSAAASARGGCRPDGFGCYQRGSERFGFFLEYDRGTERAREYAAKFDGYYRYRGSGAATRDYAGFPTLLIYSTTLRAEDELAHQAFLTAERHSGLALPVLLTTPVQVQASPVGLLGPVSAAAGPQVATQARRGPLVADAARAGYRPAWSRPVSAVRR